MKRHCSKPFAPLTAAIVLFVSIVLLPHLARAADTLTNAADVLALPAEVARAGVPIHVKGVVTAAETNWDGRFFVQDASGGVFVDNRKHEQPLPGDIVEVTGVSHPGGYAPVITKPHWTKIDTGSLPEAKPVTIDRLMSGVEDSQRIQISGIVRTAQFSGSRIGVELASGGYRFRAYFPFPEGMDPASLVGASVVVKGTAAAAFNAPLRHILTVTLFAPQPSDFVIVQPGPANLFSQPLTPLNSIAQYRNDNSPGNQVHVKGVVTYQHPGETLFIQDETGGLQIKCKSMETVVPGQVIEAVGFPAVKNYLPVLEDALFHKTDDRRVDLAPKSATVDELQKGLHHADFVKLQGKVIDRLVCGIEPGVNNPNSNGTNIYNSNVETTLVLQSSNVVFVVEKETTEENAFLSAIPIGSMVEACGICLLDSSDDGHIKSFHLLLPTSHDVAIIERPGWLTPEHLLISLLSVFAVLLVALGWSFWVAQKNSTLKSLVQEKETAQHELQQAHDFLEERVKERTAQLKVEMTARKESELQFRAVLTERTRLAQELHDTLEQTMTGIALQQDLAANLFSKNPENATHHLKLARSLMRQSQADLHRSVWGLRSRADEKFNLANALITSVRQITGDTGVQVEARTTGEPGPLSEIIEENLLRIGQEAVTNTVKHAHASLVRLTLEFTPQQVILQIHDNGNGFNPDNCTGPKDGHFGLLGIRERTEHMGGQVQITSTPQAGTTVRVEIPLPAPDNNGAVPAVHNDHEERL